jgi:hypothetical protein
MDLTMMERVDDRWEKMEGSCLTGQSPQRAVVPVEEEEEEEEVVDIVMCLLFYLPCYVSTTCLALHVNISNVCHIGFLNQKKRRY